MQLPKSAFRNLLLPLLQELVSFPITLDDECSDAGSDLKIDDATLPDQQPAALTGSEERQPVPNDEPAPDDKAAEQVQQLPPPVWSPDLWTVACVLLVICVEFSWYGM